MRAGGRDEGNHHENPVHHEIGRTSALHPLITPDERMIVLSSLIFSRIPNCAVYSVEIVGAESRPASRHRADRDVFLKELVGCEGSTGALI